MTAEPTIAPKWIDVIKAMRIDLPEIDTEGVKVVRFEVPEFSIQNLRLAREGRDTRPGWYTQLRVDGTLWMSDTDAEQRDHFEPLWQMWNHANAHRVLINGLGLGMVLKGALSMPWVEHVDVVEKEERVARLIGGHYAQDPRVHIHVADAYEQAKHWPTGTRWDVGWSDIWANPSEDDLPSMARLNRSYGRRCGWHGCWAQEELKRIRAEEKRSYGSFRW